MPKNLQPVKLSAFIYDQALISIQKSVPFKWEDIILDIKRRLPDPAPSGSVQEWFLHSYANRDAWNIRPDELRWLLNNFFIEATGNDSKYVLTRNGEEAKDAGGIQKYNIRIRNRWLQKLAINIFGSVVSVSSIVSAYFAVKSYNFSRSNQHIKIDSVQFKNLLHTLQDKKSQHNNLSDSSNSKEHNK